MMNSLDRAQLTYIHQIKVLPQEFFKIISGQLVLLLKFCLVFTKFQADIQSCWFFFFLWNLKVNQIIKFPVVR